MWTNLMYRHPCPEDRLFLTTELLPRKATEPSIAKRIHQMVAKTGLRDPSSKKWTKFETQLVHGFRKPFNKTCKEALSADSLVSIIGQSTLWAARGWYHRAGVGGLTML